MKDRHFCGSRAPCDVSELERDEASTNERDPRRQGSHLEEVGAGRDELLARDVEGRRMRSGGDVNVTGVQPGVADADHFG